jgi:mRNA interferase RelE/StbE
MERYSIVFKTSVKKDLRNIPKHDVQKILKKISSLAIEPRPSGSKKLIAQERYRIRQGNFRILYEIRENELVVIVVKAAHEIKRV